MIRWLRQLFCAHRSTETLEYRDKNNEPWVAFWWKCHDCGKTRGRLW